MRYVAPRVEAAVTARSSVAESCIISLETGCNESLRGRFHGAAGRARFPRLVDRVNAVVLPRDNSLGAVAAFSSLDAGREWGCE